MPGVVEFYGMAGFCLIFKTREKFLMGFLSLTMDTFLGNISVGARSSRVLWNGGVLFDFQNQGKVFFCFFQGGGGVDEGDTSRDSPCFFNVIHQ